MAAKLLWKNYVTDATKNFKRDYRSYSTINMVACTIEHHHDHGPVNLIGKEGFKSVQEIREIASKNFEKVDKEYMYKNWDARIYNLLFPEKTDHET